MADKDRNVLEHLAYRHRDTLSHIADDGQRNSVGFLNALKKRNKVSSIVNIRFSLKLLDMYEAI